MGIYIVLLEYMYMYVLIHIEEGNVLHLYIPYSPPNLDDLQDLKPSVGKHLKKMLTCDSSSFNEQYGEIHFEVS